MPILSIFAPEFWSYFYSGFFLTNTSNNTALGIQSMKNSVNGEGNTAIGRNALELSTTGNYNSALGYNTNNADFSGSVILGVSATATANNQFVVGSASVNAGSVTGGANISSQYWNVIINGVAQKILLA
jgi:hypothetical protein